MSTTRTLDLNLVLTGSRPVLDRFAALEPKPWDRRAVLLELVGELGSLAHHAQHWDGFKQGFPSTGQLGDECSDVLFVVLRLAKEDGVQLPPKLTVERASSNRAADFVIKMCVCLNTLIETPKATATTLVEFLGHLASLCDVFGLDLLQAHELEMRIANQFFKIAVKRFPTKECWRHPFATFRFWQLVRQREHTRIRLEVSS